jgi:hypothetical protein
VQPLSQNNYLYYKKYKTSEFSRRWKPAPFTTCHLLQEATFTQNNPHLEISCNLLQETTFSQNNRHIEITCNLNNYTT